MGTAFERIQTGTSPKTDQEHFQKHLRTRLCKKSKGSASNVLLIQKSGYENQAYE